MFLNVVLKCFYELVLIFCTTFESKELNLQLYFEFYGQSQLVVNEAFLAKIDSLKARISISAKMKR